jgi:hypothetical protein
MGKHVKISFKNLEIPANLDFKGKERDKHNKGPEEPLSAPDGNGPDNETSSGDKKPAGV